MSNFKKMRLVDDTTSLNRDIYSPYTTSPIVQRLGSLDIEISKILNSDINEREKAKLYSQTLRKFLIYKQKHEDEEEILRRKELDLLNKKVNLLRLPPKKKKKQKKKPVISGNIITPRQRIIQPLTSRTKTKKTKQRKRKVTKPNTISTQIHSSEELTETEEEPENLYEEFRKQYPATSGKDTKNWDTWITERHLKKK